MFPTDLIGGKTPTKGYSNTIDDYEYKSKDVLLSTAAQISERLQSYEQLVLWVRKTTMNAKIMIGSILAILVIIFTIQNVTVMELRFIFWTFSMSRSLFMFLILCMGIILGWLLYNGMKRKKSMTGDQKGPPPYRKGQEI